MNIEERQIMIYDILKLCKEDKLSNIQKQKLFDIVIQSNRTNKQKERFIKFYNLDINLKKQYSYTELAKENKCNIGAIKNSLQSVITHTLLHGKSIDLVDFLKNNNS